MKKLLLILNLLLSVLSYAQNGGQANANDFLRIDYMGYSGGSHVFRIKNLQPCMEVVRYTFSGSNQNDSVAIFPYEAVFISHPASQSTAIQAKAKVTSLCGVSAPDRGWVEATSFDGVLPTKFKSINSKRLNLTTIELEFEVAENIDLTHYAVKLSKDGVNYTVVNIIFREGLVPDKKYKVIIKL